MHRALEVIVGFPRKPRKALIAEASTLRVFVADVRRFASRRWPPGDDQAASLSEHAQETRLEMEERIRILDRLSAIAPRGEEDDAEEGEEEDTEEDDDPGPLH